MADWIRTIAARVTPVCAGLAALLGALRFCWLAADFPNYSQWMVDQAKFTDEGWWSQGAVMHSVLGHWNVPGDYNPAVAAPVWPVLLGLVFHFSGVSVVAARALSAALSVATLGVVSLLVRRYSSFAGREVSQLAAAMAVLLLAASPFAFVFSRLAILETPVVLEFCMGMLAVTWLASRRFAPWFVLPVLTAIMILTKTTAITYLPALAWLAYCARAAGRDSTGRDAAGRGRLLRAVRALLTVGVLPLLLVKAYAVLAARLGYGEDWNYFFGVNAMDDVAWDHTGATLWEMLQNCMWVDRILYPLGVAVLVLSVVWLRRLWRNPLFTASWIAIAGQGAYIFRRQEDYAPRYFLLMLVPLILIVVLAFAELLAAGRASESRRLPVRAVTWTVGFAVGACVLLNVATVVDYLRHRTYQYFNAAQAIRRIIESEPKQKPLVLGVSASQLSLMTGVASINDAYGSEGLAAKIAQYRPGWYLTWNGIGDDIQPALAAYELHEVAEYPVFDDDTRNRLMLYRMVPRGSVSVPNR